MHAVERFHAAEGDHTADGLKTAPGAAGATQALEAAEATEADGPSGAAPEAGGPAAAGIPELEPRAEPQIWLGSDQHSEHAAAEVPEGDPIGIVVDPPGPPIPESESADLVPSYASFQRHQHCDRLSSSASPRQAPCTSPS